MTGAAAVAEEEEEEAGEVEEEEEGFVTRERTIHRTSQMCLPSPIFLPCLVVAPPGLPQTRPNQPSKAEVPLHWHLRVMETEVEVGRNKSNPVRPQNTKTNRIETSFRALAV